MYGISLDSVSDQARFVEQHDLGFSLLSDPDGSVAAKYRVLTPDGKYARRVTFVFDESGVLRLIDRDVRVEAHGADLLERIAELRD